MSVSILSSILSQPQFTVASGSGTSVITGVKVIKVSIKLSAMIPKHMREDGTTLVDARFILPTTISADIICPTIDDVNDVINLMNDRTNLYTVTSKGLVFNNMMLQNTSTNQSAKMLSSAPFQLVFTELLQENVNPVVCQQPGDSDNQDSGLQLLNTAANSVSTLVTTVGNNASSVVNSVENLFR